MEPISKSTFKDHVMEVLSEIEQSGIPRVITDHGKPTLEIRKLWQGKASPLELLKGTVIKYVDATEPVDDDNWRNA